MIKSILILKSILLKKISLLPKKILNKFLAKIISEINEIKFSYSKRENKQTKSFKNLGFSESRKFYTDELDKCLTKLELPKYDENIGMYSEHLIIFTALKFSNLNPKKILEIGTHDGKTASILSTLFPKALITTIDLKDNDPLFKNTYNRKYNHEEFTNSRNNFLKKRENINFIQSNSLHLSFSERLKGQDLIWVDGAHGYPVLTSDITNCLRLLNSSGIIMCDDVWKKLNKNDSIYSSVASFQTLSSFSDIDILETIYLFKRLGKRFNGNYKFVSLSKFKAGFKSLIN